MVAQGEQTGRYKGSNGKTAWLQILLVLLVPTGIAVGSLFVSNYRIDANAQDIEDNGAAISTIPSAFVPRNELDAKLQNIELQVEAVQKSVDAYASQSERQTAEIIRRIERLDRPPS